MHAPRQRPQLFLLLRQVEGIGWSLVPALCLALGLLWLTRPVAHASLAVVADTPIDGLTAQNSSPARVNDTVYFTASVTSGDNISYTWNFGDGASGGDLNATHAYAAAGVYTATVTATNDASTRVATMTVIIGDAVVQVGPNFTNAYSPKDVTISEGETVVWVLRSGTHSVTADDGSFEQPLGSNWSSYMHTFDAAGSYPYYCVLHGAPGGVGMSGTVEVTSSGATLSPRGFLPLVVRMSEE